MKRHLSEIKHVSRLGDRYSAEHFSTLNQDEGLDGTYSWGEGGTLRNLLPRIATWSASNGIIATPFLGLSSHGRDHGDENPFGRHGDIRPDTILWFKMPSGDNIVQYAHDQGSVQISNFGWSKISEAVDAMSIGALTLKSEVEHLGLAYPASDIWAFDRVSTVLDGLESMLRSNCAPIFDLHDLEGKSFQDDGLFNLENGERAVRPSVSEVRTPTEILRQIIIDAKMLTKY